MRLHTLSFVLLVSLALTKAIPSPKVIEKKSVVNEDAKLEAKSVVSEDAKLEAKEDVKIEDSGDTKDRSKKSTTTFCVEIRPGASEPTRTVCGCNDKGQLINNVPEKAEAIPQPPSGPAPKPAPQPAPRPIPQPAPQPPPRPSQTTVHFVEPAREPCEIHIVQPAPRLGQIVEILQPSIRPIEVLQPTVIPLPQPQEIVKPAPLAPPHQTVEIIQPAPRPSQIVRPAPVPAPRPTQIEVVHPAPAPAPAPAPSPAPAPRPTQIEVVQPIHVPVPAPASVPNSNEHASVVPTSPSHNGQIMFMIPSQTMVVPEQPAQPGVIQISGNLCPYQQHPGHPFVTECSCRAKDVGVFHRSANAEPLKMIMPMGEKIDSATFRTHQKHPHTIVPIVLYPQGTAMPTQGSMPYVVQYNAQYPSSSSAAQARDGASQLLMRSAWPDARTSIIVNPHSHAPHHMVYQKGYETSYHNVVPGYSMSPSMIGPHSMGTSVPMYRDDNAHHESAMEVSDLMKSFPASPKVPRNTDSEQNDENDVKEQEVKPKEAAATSAKMNDEQSANTTV